MNKTRTGDKRLAAFGYKSKQDKLFARLFTRYPALIKMWARHSDLVEFSDSPWTRLTDPVSQCRLALVTTAGVHLLSQSPFNMQDPSGDPTFREIPADASHKNLMITHNYYDHTDADRDVNIVLPLERVLELRNCGDIGHVNHRHFSFMGHIAGQHVQTLMRDTAPRVASALKADDVDIVILTPA